MFYWYKALHLIFMVTWFAGLFYLPRLFVYHSMSKDRISIDRFKTMERKLFYGIMTPGAMLTLFFGFFMLFTDIGQHSATMGWFHIKMGFILLLIFYHIYCGKLLFDFKREKNQHSHTWYRWFNEIAVLLLIIIVILAVLKPI